MLCKFPVNKMPTSNSEFFAEVSGRFPAGFRQVSGRFPAGFRQVSGRFPNFLLVLWFFFIFFLLLEKSGNLRGRFPEVSGDFRIIKYVFTEYFKNFQSLTEYNS
jgi:hypothetical protein